MFFASFCVFLVFLADFLQLFCFFWIVYYCDFWVLISELVVYSRASCSPIWATLLILV